MSDYPKFTWNKSIIPDMPSEISETVKEYARRQMRYIPLPDPYALSMSFEKFKELWDKRRSIVVVDEPTQVRPRLARSINPARKSLWVKEFEKWLKDNYKKINYECN